MGPQTQDIWCCAKIPETLVELCPTPFLGRETSHQISPKQWQLTKQTSQPKQATLLVPPLLKQTVFECAGAKSCQGMEYRLLYDGASPCGAPKRSFPLAAKCAMQETPKQPVYRGPVFLARQFRTFLDAF
jgi:hypothetical protein